MVNDVQLGVDLAVLVAEPLVLLSGLASFAFGLLAAAILGAAHSAFADRREGECAADDASARSAHAAVAASPRPVTRGEEPI